MLYKSLMRPALFSMDPETAHHGLIGVIKSLQRIPGGLAMVRSVMQSSMIPALAQRIWDVSFANPVGLAAGFDKYVELTLAMQALGFGFEEVGSLSHRPWGGNPKPRVFRLPEDQAIVNRMGLNNPGVKAVTSTLQRVSQSGYPVGVSLVKTPDPAVMGEAGIADYAAAVEATHGLGAYVSLNISCPNTEEGKTFEDPEALSALLQSLRETARVCEAETGCSARPWLLKVSPDLSDAQLGELFDVALTYDIAGWIATNTSSQREGLRTPEHRLSVIGRGGLSGRPVQEASTRTLATLYRLCRERVPDMVCMGVGGVFDVATAWEKITHGASLIQLYTGLIYEGPGLVKRLNQGLAMRLQKEGFSHLSEAVGVAVR